MKKILQTRIETPSFIVAIERAGSRKMAQFFERPFSIWASAVLALIFGALSPVPLRILDHKRYGNLDYDFYSVPWYPLIFTIAVLAILYWNSKHKEFRWTRRTIAGTVLAVLLFVGCMMMSYIGCFKEHLCMGGHLDHPPYPALTYLFDAAWPVGLIVAVIAFCRCRSPLATCSAAIAGFLISFRFVFGSFGAIYPWF